MLGVGCFPFTTKAEYIRDPDGVLARDGFIVSFDSDADLPADAADTGYHHEGPHLWISADRTIAYLVDGDHIEAWPTSDEFIGCA